MGSAGYFQQLVFFWRRKYHVKKSFHPNSTKKKENGTHGLICLIIFLQLTLIELLTVKNNHRSVTMGVMAWSSWHGMTHKYPFGCFFLIVNCQNKDVGIGFRTDILISAILGILRKAILGITISNGNDCC
jgi:DMSO/TMAO reductase YedYZ heme-binding membrane subunit